MMKTFNKDDIITIACYLMVDHTFDSENIFHSNSINGN